MYPQGSSSTDRLSLLRTQVKRYISTELRSTFLPKLDAELGFVVALGSPIYNP